MSKLKTAATVLALLAVLFLSLVLTGCGNDEWNGWASGCLAQGGHPALTHHGEWSDRYECFKDDKIIVVPGYAGE